MNDENENIDKNEILVEDYTSSDGIVEINDNQYASLIDKIKKQFDLVGIKDEVIFKTISDGLQATKMFIDKFGDEHVEPDHIVRHKYLLTALELLQYIGNKSDNSSSSVTNNYTQVIVNSTALTDRIDMIRQAQGRL